MSTRAAGILGPGDHASRPAGSGLPEATLYVCTEHGTIDQWDGTVWTTWATLGTTTPAAGDVTVEDVADDLTATNVEDALAEILAVASAAAPLLTPATVPGTTYTLDVGDDVITFSADCTVTLPSDADAAIPVGWPPIYLRAGHVDGLTLVAGSGASVTGGLTIGQHETVTVFKSAADTWQATGGITP